MDFYAPLPDPSVEAEFAPEKHPRPNETWDPEPYDLKREQEDRDGTYPTDYERWMMR